MTGTVADMRQDMQTLLPVEPHVTSSNEDGVPEYPTQDELYEEPDDGSTSGETTASDVIKFENLFIGDIVEVFWAGDNEWYEGSITDVDSVDRQFEVFYKSDSQKLWHNEKDYPVRTAD